MSKADFITYFFVLFMVGIVIFGGFKLQEELKGDNDGYCRGIGLNYSIDFRGDKVECDDGRIYTIHCSPVYDKWGSRIFGREDCSISGFSEVIDGKVVNFYE